MSVIAIIGTGLVGGSLGLRLRQTDPGRDIVGFDPDGTALELAVARGAVSRAATSCGEAVQEADLVFLAMPVGAFPEVLAEVAAARQAGSIVTDVCSSKAEIVVQGEGSIGDLFVGGHPMAGSERHGIEAADAGLFEDAAWVLTPTSKTSPDAYRRVAALVSLTGAKAIAVPPEVHDAVIARLSHMPQLVASAVVSVVTGSVEQESHLGLAAGGFRDVTRIAASTPELWVSILRSNRQAVLDALGELVGELEGVRTMLSEGNEPALRAFLTAARNARVELFSKPAYAGEPIALSLLIPDRPGVLAEVTTAAGALGANIEDIQIFHSTEGGRGRLELIVAGREPAGQLEDRLTELGYHVDLGLPE